MTQQIGSHGLFCIDDNDYAAYALAMQCNAVATDEALEASGDAMTAAVTRPWINVVNNNALVVSSASGFVGPFNLVGELLRPSTSTAITVTASGISPAFSSTDPSTFMPEGIFLIGATVQWTLAAATANSIRQLLVYGLREIDGTVSSATTYTDLFRNQDYQGDGGNSGALMIAGLLDTRAGDVATIEAFFSHSNVGDLTIPVGGFRVWATYLGSGLTL